MCRLIYFICFIFLISSCNSFSLEEQKEEGSLFVNFNGTAFSKGINLPVLLPVIDTSRFIFTILAEDGTEVYHGYYGERPADISLTQGLYTLSVISSYAQMPKFNSPLYGDKQTVQVISGKSVSVSFMCVQQNAGIKLIVSKTIKALYPSGYMLFEVEGDISSRYEYFETRFLYSNEGDIILSLQKDINSRIELLRRRMQKSEMLTLRVGSDNVEPGVGEGGIRITIDTSRIWLDEFLDIGDIDNKDKAVSVNVAKTMIDEDNIWVFGYIVGGDLSSSSVKLSTPFKSETNFAIATSRYERNRARMMSVELPKGEIRDALNLVLNPSNLGKLVYIKGSIVESYFGLVGLKKTKEFEW